MWLEPKTDWKPTDKINIWDFNRILNNIQHVMNLKQYADEYYISQYQLETPKTVDDFPYCEVWNNLEDALNVLNSRQPLADFGETKHFVPYDRYINWEELNRLERLCLQFKEFIETHTFVKQNLSFTLGNYGGVKI